MRETMELTGPEKAVLMLLSLDESAAAPVIAELEADDIRKLREVASLMRAVPAQALNQVYVEFLEKTSEAVAVPRGGIHYLNRIARRALGDAKAQELFLDVPQSAMERLNGADPTALAAVLENEHPQLAAAVMSQLDPAKGAKVLARLPEGLRPTILERLSSLTEVPAGLLEEVASALSAELPASEAEAVVSVDGIAQTAAMLRKLDRSTGETLLGTLDGENAELANRIRRSMYGFEDLKVLDARAMRSLLEAVPVERLTVALKTASDELKEKIFGSLSRRAAERIREDIEILGAVRLAEVEAAQQEIVETALRLAAEGVFSLDNEGEELA